MPRTEVTGAGTYTSLWTICKGVVVLVHDARKGNWDIFLIKKCLHTNVGNALDCTWSITGSSLYNS